MSNIASSLEMLKCNHIYEEYTVTRLKNSKN